MRKICTIFVNGFGNLKILQHVCKYCVEQTKTYRHELKTYLAVSLSLNITENLTKMHRFKTTRCVILNQTANDVKTGYVPWSVSLDLCDLS